jgi:hypothetical protein
LTVKLFPRKTKNSGDFFTEGDEADDEVSFSDFEFPEKRSITGGAVITFSRCT